MGGSSAGLTFSPRPPTVVLMAGLQGSGKTTATAKLAKMLREQNNSSVAVAACDVYRPAAVEQLVKVGGQAGATVYEQGTDSDPVDIAGWALDQATRDGKDVLIVDTSRPPARRRGADGGAGADQEARPPARGPARGRRHDRPGRRQRRRAVRRGRRSSTAWCSPSSTATPAAAPRCRSRRSPASRSCTPPRARSSATSSASTPTAWPSGSSGWATSCRSSRRPRQSVEEDEAKELERKLRKNQFTLEDFLDQLKRIRKMGPLTSILGMIPGLAGHQLSKMQVDDSELDRVEAIILSMTPVRAPPPGGDQGLAPAADRQGQRHQRPAGQPAGQAVRRDAQDDARAAVGQDARPRPAHAAAVTSSAILPRRNGSQHATHPRRREEGSGVARRRRGSALSPRRALHRDGRPLQRADRPVDDRAQRGAHPPLARPRRPAERHGQEAPQDAGHRSR